MNPPQPVSPPLSPPAIAAIAFAFLVTMLGTTLPTPLYAIYSARLDFSELTVTILFAVYALGVVGALLCFGRLSDQVGRRPVLVAATTLAGLSAVLFLLPPSLPLLVVARVVSGLAAGLMSGTGTAALIDAFAPERRTTAGALAVGANAGGLAVGTLLAGIVAELAGAPLVVPYGVHLALAVVAAAGLYAFVPAPERTGRVSVRFQRLSVPAEIRGAFVRAVLAAGSGFAAIGVLTAVSSLFLARSLHHDSHALAGFVVFLAFGGMALGQLAARGTGPRTAIVVGCTGLVVAAATLALALAAVLLVPLLVAAAVLGLASGLCLNAGLALTVEQAEPASRGAVSSSFFAGLYLMLAVPAIGVGLLASAIGLRDAGLVFVAAAAVLVAVVGALTLRSARRPVALAA